MNHVNFRFVPEEVSLTVKVNGKPRTYTGALSSGPGTPVHTYSRRGEVLHRIGAHWFITYSGTIPFTVEVTQ